ncbi:MAG: hypothetical protein ACKVLC_07185, partial [Phycisphaerales bacterium]
MSISSSQSQPPTETPEPAPERDEGMDAPKESLWERFEAYVSKLSTKNNFWHRVCSLIWLP